MAHRTTFAGLAAPDAGDSIEVLNSDFIYRNPDLIDQFLKIGAISHRHDGHLALTNPQRPVTLASAVASGSLSGTYAVTYTLNDSRGGETLPASAAQITVPGQVPTPAVAPAGVVDHGAGIMPAGNYAYAMTYTDGLGGETDLGPVTWVYVDPAYASSEVKFSGLSAELSPHGTGIQWRLWRSYEAEDWHLVTQSGASAFTDAGFDPPDNPARPPAANDTSGGGAIIVTLPTAGIEPSIASAAQINVYFSTDPAFLSPAFEVSLPIACAGHSLTITNDITQDGTPPAVSTSTPGAAKIDPDTDILDWHWKRPVATYSALGSGTAGDVRMTLDTGALWGVLNSSGAVNASGWADLYAVASAYLPAFTIMASAAGGSARISDLLFQASGGAGVSFTDLGGGSGLVMIGAGTSGGGGGGSSLQVTASGGASAITPANALEFDASGGIGLSIIQTGTGSGQILIGPAPSTIKAGARSGASVYVVNGTPNTISEFGQNPDGTLTALSGTGLSAPAQAGSSIGRDCVSPDGMHVYVVGQTGNNLRVYTRRPDGTLAPIQTVTGLNSPAGVTCGPGGKHVYVANKGTSQVLVYNRAADGQLTLLQSVSSNGASNAIVVSPDGLNVYTANYADNTVTRFKRNVADGTVVFLDTIAAGNTACDLAISPDGKNLYVVQTSSTLLRIFNRRASDGALTANGTTATIATGSSPTHVVVSPDGSNVYTVCSTTSGPINQYARNSANGSLVSLGNASLPTGTFPSGLDISGDGYYLYTTGNSSQIAYALKRSPDGTLSQIGATSVGTGSIKVLFGPVNQAVLTAGDIEFQGSGGIRVSVGSGSTGSALIVIANTPPAVAGSAGVTLITPDYYTEYAGSGGIAIALQDMGSGSARVLIGGAGLGYRIFNVKDYGAKGNGSDDTAAITAATNAMIAAGSGNLYFPAGFYVTGPLPEITVPCQITGAGRGAGSVSALSVLQLKDGSNDTLIKLAAKGITVADLSLYGNSANQTGTSHGIVTSSVTPCNYFRIRDVWISSFLTDGINLANSGSSLESEIRGVEARTNGAHGIAIGSGCADMSVINAICAQNALSGLWVNAATLAATGVHCWGNGTSSAAAAGDCAGMFMQSGSPGTGRFINCYFETNGNATVAGDGARPRGSGNIFQGCQFSANRGRGMYVFSGSYVEIVGCTFVNNNQNGGATTGGAGLTLDTCTACVVADSAFFDTQTPKTQTYGYAEVGNTCTDCKFMSSNICRTADNLTGSVLVGTGNPVKTFVGGAETASIRDNAQAGMYSHAMIENTMGAGNVAASASYFKRVVPARDMTITKIAVGVATVASNSDQIDVGIYDTTGTLLASVGASTPGLTSTGVKLLTLSGSVTLKAGQVYYVALAYGTVGGANAANFNGVGATFAGISLFGSAIPQLEQFKIAANFPLATVANFSGFSTNGACPLFALRES